jgi:FKBP-type peptidyl-prolyl cis-trans isomerase FkpA/FKBP-type peptidyl-prolyl cis-trans isomerase FklB
MRLSILPVTLIACLALVSGAHAEQPALDSDEDKILYTMGLAMSRSLTLLQLDEGELALVKAGLSDGALGREPRVVPELFGPKIQPLLEERMAKLTDEEQKAGQAFRDKAAGEPGVVKTDSGLLYREIEPGDGSSPGPEDTVKVHYKGTLRDGTVFDTSLDGEASPVSFGLKGVIGCFSEGLQMMKTGGKSRLICPPEIAYGNKGAPPRVRPGATLVFEVQLLEIEAQQPPTPAAP